MWGRRYIFYLKILIFKIYASSMATPNTKTDAYYNYFRFEKSSNLWHFIHYHVQKI